MAFYVNDHESQYGPGRSERTRAEGCVWTTVANGCDAATGGRVDPEPDVVLSKVRRSEETNPVTPGWSLEDAQKAAARLGVSMVIKYRWTNLVADHNDGYYIALQGDSDRFADGSCSGTFDGDHCVGIPPISKDGRWLMDDPICPTARYEYPATLKRYAEKFDSRVKYAIFLPRVPQTEEDMIDLYDVVGIQQARFKAGAKFYDRPNGKAVATVKDPTHWYELCAKDKGADWYLIGAGGDSPMRYARVADIAARQSIPANSGRVTITLGSTQYVGSVTAK